MTDCRGLSEEEAKMLLELELLAATTEARSKHEVSQRPKSKRNLGHRMRAVKEEEEEDKEERAASTLGFKIEVEYDADWTQESEGAEVSHSQLACGAVQGPMFCGASDVSTAASSGCTALDEPQDPLDLESWEESQAFHRQQPGRRPAASGGQPRPKARQVKVDSGYPGSAGSRGVHTAPTGPQIRILARPVAEEREVVEKSQAAEAEDPWSTGPDPWSIGRQESARSQGRQEGKGAKGRSRRGQAG